MTKNLIERLNDLAEIHPNCWFGRVPWPVPIDPRDLRELLNLLHILSRYGDFSGCEQSQKVAILAQLNRLTDKNDSGTD